MNRHSVGSAPPRRAAPPPVRLQLPPSPTHLGRCGSKSRHDDEARDVHVPPLRADARLVDAPPSPRGGQAPPPPCRGLPSPQVRGARLDPARREQDGPRGAGSSNDRLARAPGEAPRRFGTRLPRRLSGGGAMVSLFASSVNLAKVVARKGSALGPTTSTRALKETPPTKSFRGVLRRT